MERVNNIKTDTYRVNDQFMVDVITFDDRYEGWLYSVECEVKVKVFITPKTKRTYDQFVDMITSEIDEEIEYFIKNNMH